MRAESHPIRHARREFLTRTQAWRALRGLRRRVRTAPADTWWAVRQSSRCSQPVQHANHRLVYEQENASIRHYFGWRPTRTDRRLDASYRTITVVRLDSFARAGLQAAPRRSQTEWDGARRLEYNNGQADVFYKASRVGNILLSASYTSDIPFIPDVADALTVRRLFLHRCSGRLAPPRVLCTRQTSGENRRNDSPGRDHARCPMTGLYRWETIWT